MKAKRKETLLNILGFPPVAIDKRVKKLFPPMPESFSKLTEKEKRFALAVANGGMGHHLTLIVSHVNG